MEHNQIQELLSAYYDEELNSEQMKTIQIHLLSCSDCQKQLAEYSKMTGSLSQFFSVSVSDSFVENVMFKIENNFNERDVVDQNKMQWKDLLFRWAAPAFGLALTALFILFSFPERNMEVSTETLLLAEVSPDFTSKWMGVSSPPEKEEIYEFFLEGL